MLFSSLCVCVLSRWIYTQAHLQLPTVSVAQISLTSVWQLLCVCVCVLREHVFVCMCNLQCVNISVCFPSQLKQHPSSPKQQLSVCSTALFLCPWWWWEFSLGHDRVWAVHLLLVSIPALMLLILCLICVCVYSMLKTLAMENSLLWCHKRLVLFFWMSNTLLILKYVEVETGICCSRLQTEG